MTRGLPLRIIQVVIIQVVHYHNFFTSIARPEVRANNINYPYSLIHLIQGNLFQGLPNEDPYGHLATFIENVTDAILPRKGIG